MKCVVTGVAGFIGSHLSEELLSRGYDVVGIDCFTDYYDKALKQKNLERLLDNASFSFIEGDICEVNYNEILADAVYVYHQAAQAGVRASWGRSFQSYTHSNIKATQMLLEACKGSLSLKRLVYASSSSVYGTAETLPTTESIIPAPVSPYGVTKLAAEHLCELYRKEFNVPTRSLRYFTVFGPRQRPDMAFNIFSRKALRGTEINIYGDGEQSRDFTFISDIVAANILAAEQAGDSFVFNVGGGNRATVNQVLELLGGLSGAALKVNYMARQKGDARHTAADCSLAAEVLSYQPKVDLKEGLTRELEWVQSNLDLLPE